MLLSKYDASIVAAVDYDVLKLVLFRVWLLSASDGFLVGIQIING